MPKRRDQPRFKTSVGIAPDLWRAVKLAAVVANIEMYDLVDQALRRELRRPRYRLPQQPLPPEETPQ